ncbi:MAG: heterodisulfide reductase-related iron-sulfur binding cluster [Dehalococcoidia bacterium]|nr:heterodisulfide reductase-related iron-sulfur binding cluster [Dehalococcoidia bacterium]
MPEDLISNKKVAYYAGCFANYYYPEVGEALVKVLGKNGIKVMVPDQVCCGLPMMAKGNTKGAYENMEHNTRILGQAVSDGYVIITTCSSCGLFLKRDYPLWMVGSEMAKQVPQNTYHFSEYLLLLHDRGELNTDFRSITQTVFYHTPCHLSAQEIGDVTVKLLQLIPGITIKRISTECCGMGGAYGYEKVNYELSKEIAEKLYSEIKENPTDRIVTDCGGCRLQIQAGTGLKVDHPIILLKEAYSL